jgi:branched-chain amino acid transport system substrate-binding protein
MIPGVSVAGPSGCRSGIFRRRPRRAALDTILQLILNGVAVGCIYGLVALGLVLIYKAQADKMKLKIVETTTHKPTDQDFTAHVTKLKAKGCDLVVLGTIVRDSIVPYATARKIGWTDVDFLGSPASYDLFVAGTQGGVTEGLYAMGLTDMPYRDKLGPAAQAWFDKYKERYKVDPNIGAVYGHVAADLTVVALEKAGTDLTLDAFLKALESIKGYHDIFNGPEVNFGPDKHQGANSSFLAVVKGGRWVRLTDPLTF